MSTAVPAFSSSAKAEHGYFQLALLFRHALSRITRRETVLALLSLREKAGTAVDTRHQARLAPFSDSSSSPVSVMDIGYAFGADNGS